MKDDAYYEKLWDDAFKKGHFRWTKADKPIYRICKILLDSKARKVLDLGCGMGRHMVYLAKKGLYVVGLDTSETALRLARVWMKMERLKKYRLVNASLFDIPFPDRHFDAVISTATIDNFAVKDVEKAVDESRRVLKKGGFFYGNFLSTKHENFLRWKALGWNKVSKYTFFHKELLLQSFFTEDMIKKLFSKFDLVEMNERSYYKRLYTGAKKMVAWEILAKKR